jgi:peptidoglycan/LPS O-acetylase OafA/YrhL
MSLKSQGVALGAEGNSEGSFRRRLHSVHLDAIRGTAALIVFLAHGRNVFFGTSHSAASSTAAAVGGGRGDSGIGHQAVMVFFVLSGYLVGGGVLRGMKSGAWNWSGYLRQRVIRLWVVLLPALIVGCIMDNVGMRAGGNGAIYNAPAGQSLLVNPVSNTLNVSTFIGNLFFLQRIRVPDFGSNKALWSVANEFWYYLAFPLLLILLRSSGLRARAFCLVGLIVCAWVTGSSVVAYFSIWLLGAGISIIPLRLGRRSATILAAVSLLMLAAGSAWFRTHDRSQYVSDAALALIFSVALYACLHHRDFAPNVYSNLAGGMARMSYTLYLFHLPALIWLNSIFVSPWRPWPKDPVHLAAFAAIVSGVIFYSGAMYLAFERHTDRIRNAFSAMTLTPAPRVVRLDEGVER